MVEQFEMPEDGKICNHASGSHKALAVVFSCCGDAFIHTCNDVRSMMTRTILKDWCQSLVTVLLQKEKLKQST